MMKFLYGLIGLLMVTAANAATPSMDSLILIPGSAPGSPTNGQIWMTSSGLFGRVAGSTVGPYGTGGSSGLTIASTTITGGTTTRVLFDNAGVLGEYTITGSGNVVMSTSPTLVTPILGTPTSVNLTNATNYPKGSSSTFGIMECDNTTVTCPGGVLSSVGGAATAITPGTTTIVGATAPCAIVNSATTVMGCVAETGTGSVVLATSPTLVTPLLGTPTSGDASNLTNIPVSAAKSGSILPAANGGAGTVNGALKGNGSGTVSLAASTDLSNSANIPLLNAANVYSAQQSSSVTTLTISTATFTPTGANNNYSITLVHASCPCTLANPSATPVAGTSGQIIVNQSSTGSDTIGTYGSQYASPGGTSTITLSTAANARDVLSYYVVDSTHILLLPSLNFSH